MLDEHTVNLLDELARNINPEIKEVDYSPITKFIMIYDHKGKRYKLDTQGLNSVDIFYEFSKIVKEIV